MIVVVHNFRRSWTFQSTVVILVALLIMVLLMGVTFVPMLRVRDHRQAHRMAEQRAAELESSWASLRDFEDARGFERVRDGIDLVRALVPEECSTIELHSAVRMAATTAGVELESVSPGSVVELRADGFDGDLLDRVMQREVLLTGNASVSGLVELVDAMKQHGYPTTTLDLALFRENPEDGVFHVRATLGLFHRSSRKPTVTQGAEDLEEVGVEGNSEEE